MKEKRPQNNRLLIQYAGMAAQLIVSLAIAVYIGVLADRWVKLSFPLFVWLLPLAVVISMIIKAIKDTSNK